MQSLIEADQRRRQAMIERDSETLEALLHDNLIWTHSSGKTDSKTSFIDRVSEAKTLYERIEVLEYNCLSEANVHIMSGVFEGNAVVNGTPKKLKNRFLSVWTESDGNFRMLAWQSTGL